MPLLMYVLSYLYSKDRYFYANTYVLHENNQNCFKSLIIISLAAADSFHLIEDSDHYNQIQGQLHITTTKCAAI